MRRAVPTLINLLPVLLLGLPACGPEHPREGLDDWPPGGQRQAITDGKLYSGHPSVGYLRAHVGSSVSTCTATLVGKHTVLTAAHCIKVGYKHTIQLQGLYYTARSVSRHPSFVQATLANDIGVVILEYDPPVTPSEASKLPPAVGQQITLIGYGNTSYYAPDMGLKRIAVNNVHKLEPTVFSFKGTGGGTGSTCRGDSGGPAFAILGGKEVQVGVTSGGSQPCGTLAVDTRVDAFYGWLKTASGGDLHEGQPDTRPPQVSITLPADGARVHRSFAARVSASDDVGVASVELFLGDQSVGKTTAEPFSFTVIGSAGDQTLKAVARDYAGNRAEHAVSITILPPLGFGAACSEHLQCASDLCAGDPGTGAAFCSLLCWPGSPACPGGGACLPVGAGQYACDRPGNQPPDLQGSCAMGPAGGRGAAPSAAAGFLALALLLAARRFRQR